MCKRNSGYLDNVPKKIEEICGNFTYCFPCDEFNTLDERIKNNYKSLSNKIIVYCVIVILDFSSLFTQTTLKNISFSIT